MKTVDNLQKNWLLASEINKLEARVWRLAQREEAEDDPVHQRRPRRGQEHDDRASRDRARHVPRPAHPHHGLRFSDSDHQPALRLPQPLGLESALEGRIKIEQAITKTELASLDMLLPTPGKADPALLLRTRGRGRDSRWPAGSLRPDPDRLAGNHSRGRHHDALPLADGVILAGMAGRRRSRSSSAPVRFARVWTRASSGSS